MARKRLEDRFLQKLSEEVLQPDVLALVYERTAKKVREQVAHVPEDLKLKKVELNRAEASVHNFTEFIAANRATPGPRGCAGQAIKSQTADAASLASPKEHRT